MVGFLFLSIAFTAMTPPRFMAAWNRGADCPELFALRNELKRDATPAQAATMNDKLREVACYSSTSKRRVEGKPKTTKTFTVREYRIYRAVVDMSMSVPEAESLRRVGRQFKITPTAANTIAKKVMGILSTNDGFGTPGSEERRASDWKLKPKKR